MTKTERKLKKAMTSLRVWKPEYLTAVQICAGLMDQYDEVRGMMERGEAALWDVTDTGGTRKSAAVTTAESLRKDILSYLRELGLTALSVKRLDAQADLPTSNVLADALRGMESG